MEEMQLVSVIMGAYNCSDSVGSSIESIMNQTYPNWELIICDDCSTDNTVEVIRSYQEKCDKIVLLQNAVNQKLPFTLNRCLQYAKGKYIARMDADDISLERRFEHQVIFLNQHPEYAVVAGGVIPFDEKSEKKPRIPKPEPTRKTLYRGAPFLHPTVMVRAEAYRTLNGYTVSKRTIKGQDLDLWYRFYAHGYKGYNLQEPVLKYHESVEDYKKKRDLYAAWGMTKTKYLGFRMNHFPLYAYPYVLKPVVSALIPKAIIHKMHNKEEN